MGRFMILFAILAAACVGCARHYRDATLYHASGRAKPIVAVLPVINSSSDEQKVCWDLTREMTEELRKRVYNSPKLYLLREHGSLEIAKQLSVPNPNLLSREPIERMGAAEFIVVSELLDHHETSYGFQNPDKPHLEEIGADLTVAMRIRVLDIRGQQPKIILQEVINHEYPISRAYLNTDYEKACWGTEAFERTPIGIAHSKIVREIVARVEGYIAASRG